MRLQFEDVLKLVQRVDEVVSARGKKLASLTWGGGQRPDPDELRKLTIGPSGFLRAPAVLVGRKMLVGFSAELYDGLSS